MSLALLAVCLWALVSSLDWAVLQAVFGSNLQACNDARGAGACWGVISEKGRLIVMGRYPETEHWRPVIATALMLGVVVVSCMPRFWNKALPLIWVVMLAVYFVLMKGGFFGLTEVDTDQWGGLPLTGDADGDLHDAGLSAGHFRGAGPSLQHACHQNPVHTVCGVGARRAADHRVVHGFVHAAAVHCPRA